MPWAFYRGGWTFAELHTVPSDRFQLIVLPLPPIQFESILIRRIAIGRFRDTEPERRADRRHSIANHLFARLPRRHQQGRGQRERRVRGVPEERRGRGLQRPSCNHQRFNGIDSGPRRALPYGARKARQRSVQLGRRRAPWHFQRSRAGRNQAADGASIAPTVVVDERLAAAALRLRGGRFLHVRQPIGHRAGRTPLDRQPHRKPQTALHSTV